MQSGQAAGYHAEKPRLVWGRFIPNPHRLRRQWQRRFDLKFKRFLQRHECGEPAWNR